MLFALAGLAIGLAFLPQKTLSRNELSYVNTAQYQAVFLTNGQVYFGKVKDISKTYVDLQDIYYLNSQESTDSKQPTSFTLVKLGCELHGPNDQMIINREQVTFWENLKDDRQVVKKIGEWKQQNSGGLKCQDNATSTQQSTGSTQSTTTTTPSTNGTTKKP